MFNSQHINNDPRPYYVEENDTRYSKDEILAASILNAPADMIYHLAHLEPRPEFDNNPNLILLRFRRYCDKYPRMTLVHAAEAFLWVINGGFTLDKWSYTRERINHAKKVLERLVNVYG